MSGVQINVQAFYEKNTMQVEVAEVPIGRELEKLFFTKVAMKCCTRLFNVPRLLASHDIDEDASGAILPLINLRSANAPGITYNDPCICSSG